MNDKTEEIKSLTGLRGIAAFLVMIHHFVGYDIGKSRLAVASIHLYLAVDVFFLLSGFVMAMNYASYFTNGIRLDAVKSFLTRRIARIYPLYAFASVICAVLIFCGVMSIKAPGNPYWAIVTNIFLIAGWGFGPYIIGGPAWSISTEWGAYLIFPLLVIATLHQNKYAPIAWGLCAFAILAYMGSLPDGAFHEYHGRGGPLAIMDNTTIGPLLRCICEFSIGMLAWRVSISAFFAKAGQSIEFATGLIAAAIIVLLFGRTTDIMIVGLAAILMVLLSTDRPLTAKFLSSKVPYMLGILSYSMYLMHVPVAALVNATGLQERLASASGAFLAISVFIVIKIGLSILVSNQTYRYIENPGRRFIRRFQAAKPQSA